MATFTDNRYTQIGCNTIDRERFYTEDETAKILGVKRQTVYNRAKEGLLIRSGYAKTIFYKGENIIKFIEGKKR